MYTATSFGLFTVQSLLLLFSDALSCTFIYTCFTCFFYAVTSFLCTTVFAVAIAVRLPCLCISKFLLFSSTDDGPLRPKSNLAFYAQSWTALFRAFSSHRQPSASLTKLFPSWTRLLAELDKP